MRIVHTVLLSGLLSVLFLLAALPSPAADKEDAATLLQHAIAASRAGDLSEALRLASRAVEQSPEVTRGWLVRGQLYQAHGEFEKAVSDFGEAIRREPKSPLAWQHRGEAQFQRGKIAESIADFDRYLELAPEEKPYHWQRGISLYYAGRFADGKKQFELHQTVNPHDVENAVWHFLCTARAEGLEAARKQLIPIEGDARVPMAQVHRLFAGQATPRDVLVAAEAAPADTAAGEPLFYAHLYLGLYYEATGDKSKAREEIRQAAERARHNGYMGDVARVHADRIRSQR